MIEQYPDSVTYTIPAAPVQDLSGNWYVPDGTALTTACRAEYNSRNGTVMTQDGKVVQFDYTVYQAAHTTEIVPGTEAVITLHNGQTVTTTVKRHENNQLNSKSWV